MVVPFVCKLVEDEEADEVDEAATFGLLMKASYASLKAARVDGAILAARYSRYSLSVCSSVERCSFVRFYSKSRDDC